jgi:hypothetical protein
VLTLFLWNWNGSFDVKGLITFLSEFLDPFVNANGRNEVITHDGRAVDIEAAESEIFWSFNAFL